MKLGLGTVQFGLDYGISNNGKVQHGAVHDILAYAQTAGISVIDTATQYGTSEEVLGQELADNNNFTIVTKTPRITSNNITRTDAHLVETTFHHSLKTLGQQSLYGLLVHNANDMLKSNFQLIWQAMQTLKQQGLVQKIGVSVYTGQQIDYALDNYPPDLVQLPFNVFDQRLLQRGHLAKLKTNNVQVHARSVFLQGLLLMQPKQIPAKLSAVAQHLKNYHKQSDRFGLTSLEASLACALAQPEIDCVLVGVCSLVQLQQIVDAAKKVGDRHFDFAPFALQDEKILNPALW